MTGVGVEKNNLRVNSAHHTRLAMLSLRAVKPHWLRILDANRVCQDLAGGSERSVRGHEAREEGVGFVGHDVLDGDAGVVEGGLHDGVVLWVR
jgi:hypothetical protein